MWATLVPAVLTALLLAVVPGLIVLYLLNVRGLAIWALAAPAGITLVAVSAVVSGLLNVAYSIWAVALGTLIVGAACLVLRRTTAPSRPSPQRAGGVSGLSGGGTGGVSAPKGLPETAVQQPGYPLQKFWAAICLALAAAVILWRLVTIIGSPDNISQTFDDIYHLNSVRYIMDTGNASSLTVGQMVDPANRWAVYPAAWHDYAALVAWLSGAGVPEAINAVNIVICCVIWPAGALFLIDTVVGPSMIARGLAAAGTAGFSQFPYLMLDFGVLYPTLLATALVAPALAQLILAVDPSRRTRETGPGAWLALVLVLPGLVLAHPSAIQAVLAFGMPWLAWRWYRAFRHARSQGRRQTLPVVATALAFAGAFYAVWKYLRPDPAAATWAAHQTLAQAFGEVITASSMGRPIPMVLAILLLCGLFACYRKSEHWRILAAFCIGGALFVAVSGMWFGRIRGFLTGAWYSDSYRIAALLPIVALPIIVVGGLWLKDALFAYAERKQLKVPSRATIPPQLALLLPVAILVVYLGVTQFRTVGPEIRNAANNFQFRSDSALLSSDERLLLEELPRFVPPGETVIGSPWTGASLVYAYTGRPALLPHTQGTPGADANIILEKLNKATTDPEVCAALDRVNSRYVLDFGTREVHDGDHQYPGLENLSRTPGFENVYTVGEAKLYRISACAGNSLTGAR